MTTPDRKTLIGKVLPTVQYVINEDDLRTYLPACEEEDPPAFFSEKVALSFQLASRVGTDSLLYITWHQHAASVVES